jgi:hypothetical protein
MMFSGNSNPRLCSPLTRNESKTSRCPNLSNGKRAASMPAHIGAVFTPQFGSEPKSDGLFAQHASIVFPARWAGLRQPDVNGSQNIRKADGKLASRSLVENRRTKVILTFWSMPRR